jgi:hypothetical protein
MHSENILGRAKLRIAGEWWAAKWWFCECAAEIASCWAYWKKQRPFSKCRCCGELMGWGYAQVCEGVCWSCRQNCEKDCSQHCGDVCPGGEDVPF